MAQRIGVYAIRRSGIETDGSIAAYGVSGVTLQVDMEAGIGQIFLLEIEK